MICYFSRRASAVSALVFVSCLTFLAGCQGRKVVANVNSVPIYEDDFNRNVQMRHSIPNDPGLDAGSATLVAMIQDMLIDQLAAQPSNHAIPSETTVQSFLTALERANPDLTNNINSNPSAEEELRHQVRRSLEEFGIGTNGAHVDSSELTKAYDDQSKSGKLTYPATYTARLLVAPTRELAVKAQSELLKTGDFRAAAVMVGIPAERAASVTHKTVYSDTDPRLPQELKTAFNKLNPGQISPEPVEIPLSAPGNTQAAPAKGYVVIQLEQKEPKRTPTLKEVQPILEQRVLQEKFQQWQSHSQEELARYTEQASIQIYIDRYKGLIDHYILPAALSHTGGQPSGQTVPSGVQPAPSTPATGDPTKPQ